MSFSNAREGKCRKEEKEGGLKAIQDGRRYVARFIH